jgi:hypothetical protein
MNMRDMTRLGVLLARLATGSRGFNEEKVMELMNDVTRQFHTLDKIVTRLGKNSKSRFVDRRPGNDDQGPAPGAG